MKLGLVPIDVGVPNVGAMVALVQKAEAVGLESQHTPVDHRHHEHSPVGKPTETRRLVGHLADGLDLAARVHGQHPMIVEI